MKLTNDLAETDNGWFVSDESMSLMAQDTFMKMMNTISGAEMINVYARVDGKNYHWQCDGLKYAIRIKHRKDGE